MTLSKHKEIKEFAEEAEIVWSTAYNVFTSLINKNNLKKGVEIGVAYGGHSEAILANTKTNILYAIDPFRHNKDYIDPFNFSQERFEGIYRFSKQRLSLFSPRIKIIRKYSHEAVNRFTNSSLDYVYFDADHSYAGVLEELSDWFFKIRDNGILGGHDYNHVNFPGVKEAVDEFFTRFGWKVNYDKKSTVWWVIKKPINISFIIPAYNCADTIKQSIDSIFDGNYSQGDEIIIVNDNSTDKTKEGLVKIKEKHPQIRVISHQVNRGGGAARNTAVLNSKNQLIFCLDSDNILKSNSISSLKEFLIRFANHAVCFDEIKYFRSSTAAFSHSWKFNLPQYTPRVILSQTKTPGSSGQYLFTKTSWINSGGYPEFAYALDTWGFGLRQAFAGYPIYPMKGYYYHRIKDTSYWTETAKKIRVSLIALQILLPYADKIKESSLKYLFSHKGRISWFENIERYPILLKTPPDNLFEKLKNIYRTYIRL